MSSEANLKAIKPSYDVVVIGGGPAGSAAAVGFSRQGRRVLLLEANPKASSRFAGEWIHPTGARVLRDFGLFPHEATAAHTPCYGFAVFPDDGSEPVQLPYADESVGFSCDHDLLARTLRDAACSTPGVTYLEYARATAVTQESVTFSWQGHEHTVRAGQIVSADGRQSIARKLYRGDDTPEFVSHMAGIELDNIELPFEGHGHVILGGPGPILLYRISATRARACLDIPAETVGYSRTPAYLWDAFSHIFPENLRPAFRRSLETHRPMWAMNQFLARTFYGKDNIALVGDAVGFYHPLTAGGITVALKDVEMLLEAKRFSDYATAREAQTYAPELLASALFHVFTREDESAHNLRRAVFDTWRNDPVERTRTMRILTGDELRLSQFRGAFVHIAARAVRDATVSAAKQGSVRAVASEITNFAEWAQWPGATFLPRLLRSKLRQDGTRHHPLKGLRIAPPVPFGPVNQETPSVLVDVDGLLAKPCETARSAELCTRLAEELLVAVGGEDLRRAIDLTLSIQREIAHAPLSAMRDAAVALREARSRFPGLLPGVVEGIWQVVESKVHPQLVAANVGSELAQASLAIEALHACGWPAHHPALRLTRRTILLAQRPDGSFGTPTTTTLACRALLRTQAPSWPAIEAGLQSLAEASLLPSEAHETIRLYRDLRTLRLGATRVEATHASDADHQYCREALLAVSRSFARPIEMLPGHLRTAVTCGYLLCRIADTIEDNAEISLSQQDSLFEHWLVALRGTSEELTRFERMFDALPGNAVENGLCAHTGTVLRVFRTLPESMQTSTLTWVEEMTRGMHLYCHRPAGADGYKALVTTSDLERYCYYVAGTVGHMLTELFIAELGSDVGLANRLRCDAEEFGAGLQLVNILKDVTDDRTRKVSFIPRTTIDSVPGLTLANLTDEERRGDAHVAVRPLFDVARAKLDRALEYSLAIPSEQSAIRLFCVLPLWMAARTLVLGQGNDAMFVAGAPVKIPREEVEKLIASCIADVGNDSALRAQYAALWKTPSSEHSTEMMMH